MRKTARVPASLRGLLLGSLFLLRSQRRAIGLGILTFALVGAVSSTYVGERVHEVEERLAAEAHIDLDALSKKATASLEKLSEAEILLFASRIRQQGFVPGEVTEKTLGLEYAVRTGPYVLGLFLFDLLLSFVAWTFFLRLFVRPEDGAAGTAKKTPLLVLKMILLFAWLFFRSLLWIPFIGPVLAMYFIPRLAAAPAAVASDEASILQSTHISMMRTSHMWARNFLALVLIAIVCGSALWFFLVISSIVSLFALKVGFLLWLCFVFLTVAYHAAYMAVLSASLE